MSNEVLITYREQNKFDKYHSLPEKKKLEIQDVIAMFIKELLTLKGSNLFDPDYGSTFLDDISKQVNFYKIEYFLQNNYKDLYRKYNIESINVQKTNKNNREGVLEVWLTIYFKEYAVEYYTNFLYNGVYTEGTIIEMD